jgi:hypothetical protein
VLGQRCAGTTTEHRAASPAAFMVIDSGVAVSGSADMRKNEWFESSTNLLDFNPFYFLERQFLACPIV